MSSRFAKVGPFDVPEKNISQMLESGKRFIVTRTKVYHLDHVNYRPEFIPFYGRLVYSSPKPLTIRGRYQIMNAEGANRVIGHNLFTD